MLPAGEAKQRVMGSRQLGTYVIREIRGAARERAAVPDTDMHVQGPSSLRCSCSQRMVRRDDSRDERKRRASQPEPGRNAAHAERGRAVSSASACGNWRGAVRTGPSHRAQHRGAGEAGARRVGGDGVCGAVTPAAPLAKPLGRRGACLLLGQRTRGVAAASRGDMGALVRLRRMGQRRALEQRT